MPAVIRHPDNLRPVSCVHVPDSEGVRSMKRMFVLSLCIILFHTILAADAFALAPAPAPSRQALKVAGAIGRIGAGEDALVAVRLRDHSVVKGWVSLIAADSFVVSDPGSNSEQRVYYSAVERLQGVNISSG